MTPLNKEQAESIIRRIAFIEEELKDLGEYSDLDFKRYSTQKKVRREVERIIENVLNASIDIAKILLAGEDVEVPATYREAFEKLGEKGLLAEEVAGQIADLVRLRNVLAHQYLDLKWETIHKFIEKGPQAIREFGRSINERIPAEPPWE
ncbi:MAG: DUF86 domain-containing protein [Nitrospinae bacterium]|nr:DUF86 domain-containing protein [Nitrospinota bacterium]